MECLMEEMNGNFTVSDFYSGKSVFITGGSGYLGKVLIEKLVYSCPLVENVFVLLRDKRGVSAEQRLHNMINKPMFTRLRAEQPDALKKIILIRGDLTTPNLGMSSEDLQTVKSKVSVVIHSAATIKFNEPLKVALSINLEGTRNVLNLCHLLENCHAFVYVSTAYSNSNRSVIEEVVYPPPSKIDEVYKYVEQDDSDDVSEILNGLPNTYTYTKALAESYVSDNHGSIPTVIVRPSIITPAIKEPLPGWVDNWFGATAIIVPASKGILKVIYADYDNNIDIIPVDYVGNLILVAATNAKRKSEVEVYNSCTGSTNPMSLGDSLYFYTKVSLAEGFNELPFPQVVLFTKQKWLIKLITFIFYIMTYIADLFLLFLGKERRYEKILSQVVMAQNVLEFFTKNSWLIKSENTHKLYEKLSDEDAQIFPFNTYNINWKEYVNVYFNGVNKYLLCDNSKTK